MDDWRDYIFAETVEAVVVQDCEYAELPEHSHLVHLPNLSSLEHAPPVIGRVPQFKITTERRLQLRGFRGFSTEEQTFFLDESLDEGFDRLQYATQFHGTGRFEDFEASISGRTIQIREPVQLQTVVEPVIAINSAEPSNYGSWLYRVLPKLAMLPDDGRALFVYQNTQWQLDLLNFFAPGRRIINHWPEIGYILEDAKVATLRNRHVFFDLHTRSFYHRAAERVGGSSPLRKIYLSRRGQTVRSMTNEADVEEMMIDLGFAIIHPERMSLEERIRVIRDAETIVCPGGSGLFNLVFAVNCRRVLDLEPSQTWLYAHHNLMRSLGLKHGVLFGKQSTIEGEHGSWTIDPSSVASAVEILA